MRQNTQAEPMRERLREFHAQQSEECIRQAIRRAIEDPLKPRGENGRIRMNPVLVLLLAVVALFVGTFLLFSFGI